MSTGNKALRVLKIKLEAEKCLIRKGELAIPDLIIELSNRGKRFQVTPYELTSYLRSHSRIYKVIPGVYAVKVN